MTNSICRYVKNDSFKVEPYFGSGKIPNYKCQDGPNCVG